jgi:hypothetical protein
MSIKVNVSDPCSQNLAKLLHAVADYIGSHNQKIDFEMDLCLKSEGK